MKTHPEAGLNGVDSDLTDLKYRPDTYWPDEPDYEFLISRIKGKKRRDMARALHQKCDIPNLLIFLHRETLPESERTAWGRIHPSFMGGEYLAGWFGVFFEEWVRESYSEDELADDGYFGDDDSDLDSTIHHQ
ncbi:MAG: hypothetical protein ACNA8K_14560 [Cyclonatronaceae bacterium]